MARSYLFKREEKGGRDEARLKIEWVTHPHHLELPADHPLMLDLPTIICCHVCKCLPRNPLPQKKKKICRFKPCIICSSANHRGHGWTTDPTETMPRWDQDTQRRSPAINSPSRFPLRLLGPVCIHVLGMELSSYYGSTRSKAKGWH